jgi:hypothetical protein
MDTTSFGPVLLTLFNELIDGSPDPRRRTYMLNQGDAGFLVSLDRLPPLPPQRTEAHQSQPMSIMFATGCRC